jgi:hypothetical protein
MTNWAPIRYLGYWDVPLVFLVRFNGERYLFDCPFDNEVEDYAEDYEVYLFPEIPDEELPSDWTKLRGLATRPLGRIPVREVQFDPTRRRSVNTDVLERFATPAGRKL